ncbi:MAG: hypothetical protein RMJ52_14865, partial [Gemmataceae bacterium]|nr:hypothetical protein [Gemmataceae bacterium]
DADGSVALSTFQPADGNPTDGAWEAFTKYGKLGPDFGLENVFKRPIIVLRPGASFRTPVPRGWLGRALPMDELLAQDVVGKLRNLDVQVIHWAFGLCVPLRWPKGQIHSSEPIAEPIAIEESPLLPIEAVRPLERTPSPPPPAEIVQPVLQPSLAPGQVRVKVLERREIGGKVQFFVQEEGKPRGVLAYGVPPPADQLPQVGDEITVYRNNTDLRNPQYRWDKPHISQNKPRGQQPPRGGRK